MTNNLFAFEPQSTKNARDNLSQFITECKTKLTVFCNDEAGWAKNDWATIYNGKRMPLGFYKYGEHPRAEVKEPFFDGIIDFAKAYMKYDFSNNPRATKSHHIKAFKMIEHGMCECGVSDVFGIDERVIESALEKIEESTKKDGRKVVAAYLIAILTFLKEKIGIVEIPIASNPFQAANTRRHLNLDDYGKEYNKGRLPSDELMFMCMELFKQAPDLSDNLQKTKELEFFTSCLIFLSVAPSRCSELHNLTIDPFEWEDDKYGNKQLWIRWFPAKGGKAGLKEVPTVMQEVILEAYERLMRIGEPARKVAEFAVNNHSLSMYPNGHKVEPKDLDRPLTIPELEEFVSIKAINSNKKEVTIKDSMRAKWSHGIWDRDGKYTYGNIGQYFYEHCVKLHTPFPNVSNKVNQPVNRALIIHRINEFDISIRPRAVSFKIPTVSDISNRFAHRLKERGILKTDKYGKQNIYSATLWDLTDWTLSDGSFLTLNTHQIRHWVSTIAERGGMDALKLAQWAGRKKVSQNRTYDGRTEDEKVDEARELLNTLDSPVLPKIMMNIPVSFEDIGRDIAGTAILTEIGICEHDFSMLPCMKHGECETCKELVCVKGMPNALERLKELEQKTSMSFDKAVKAKGSGVFGVDRWISHHVWKLSHIRTKIAMLEDPSLPHGGIVRVPEAYDPSPIKEGLASRGHNTEIESEKSINFDDDIRNLMGF